MNSIIVYRNPLEQMFWEGLSNNAFIAWGAMILLAFIVIVFIGYVINETLGVWIREKIGEKRRNKFWKEAIGKSNQSKTTIIYVKRCCVCDDLVPPNAKYYKDGKPCCCQACASK